LRLTIEAAFIRKERPESRGRGPVKFSADYRGCLYLVREVRIKRTRPVKLSADYRGCFYLEKEVRIKRTRPVKFSADYKG